MAQRDTGTIIAVGAGALTLGVGIFFLTKKPKGVDPGDTMIARFTFDYLGAGGTFVTEISIGTLHSIGPIDIFDHITGLTWSKEVELPGPNSYVEDLVFRLPDALEDRKWDTEALIRTPDMDEHDCIVRVWGQDVFRTRKV